MRTAAICPTCATYENAICVIYDGPGLTNIEVAPLDDLTTALLRIDTAVGILQNNTAIQIGTVAPTANAAFVGQLYVNTAEPSLYFSKTNGNGAADWVKLGNA